MNKLNQLIYFYLYFYKLFIYIYIYKYYVYQNFPRENKPKIYLNDNTMKYTYKTALLKCKHLQKY